MSQTYPPSSNLLDVHFLFPYVDGKVLSSLIRHELSGTDIYKLDSRRILESEWDWVELEASTASEPSAPAASALYPTLDSLFVPLNAYFSILTLHGLRRGEPATLPLYFFRYNSHLVKLAEQYEWHAVLSYHLAFFNRRCKEMRGGEYEGWGKIEVDLMEELLVPYQRKTKVRLTGKAR